MKTITVFELKEKLDENEVLLIDVRAIAEYRNECINGAFLIPNGEICIENFPEITKPIVIYCRSGVTSVEVCKKLLKSNPSLDICSLEGGIGSWINSGFDVKKSGSKILSLDRQTQIAAGCIVFSGTILGALIHSSFYILPGFIGAGLIFAGSTGWCGMAKLLAKMPWNS